MKKLLRLAGAVALAALLGACAFGNKASYDIVTPEIDAGATGPITVGVWEQRPFVLDNDKTLEWTGLLRSMGGIPYGVHTQSGRPLADDFAVVVVAGIRPKNAAVASVALAKTDKRDDALAKLLATKPSRAVLLTMLDWRSDTYIKTSMRYDLKLEILDGAGKLLAENRVSGNDDIGFIGGPEQVGTVLLPSAQRTVLNRLFDNAGIRAALGHTGPPSRPRGKPSSGNQPPS